MKNSIILFSLSALSLAFINEKALAESSSVVATVTADIKETLAITSQTPLNFGYITAGNGGGTVVVTPQNQRSTTGGAQASEGYARAEFNVEGKPNRAYTITIPQSISFTAIGDNQDPALEHELTVNHFTAVSVTSGGSKGKLNSTGTDTIFLGGTLVVPADAAPGTYSGLVPLTVSY